MGTLYEKRALILTVWMSIFFMSARASLPPILSSPNDIELINCPNVIEVSNPQNVNCELAWEIPNCAAASDFSFQYTDLCASCCLWFSYTLCPEYSNVLGTSLSSFDGVGNATIIDPNGVVSEHVLPFSFTTPDYGTYWIRICPTGSALTTGTLVFDPAYKSCDAEPVSCDSLFSLPCEDCLEVFEPTAGTYILNAWAYEDGFDGTQTTLSAPSIAVIAYDAMAQALPGFPQTFSGDGIVIDGWQRLEGIFNLPPNAAVLSVELRATGSDVFYDDIRIFPEKGSMKCYVYDPISLRFMAELDERHYATFYEYDGEGKLTRIKKETERGIMTIQETRYNSSKISGQ